MLRILGRNPKVETLLSKKEISKNGPRFAMGIDHSQFQPEFPYVAPGVVIFVLAAFTSVHVVVTW